MSAASARSRLSTPALYVTVGFVVLIAVAGAASAAIGDNLDQCRNGVTTPPLGNLAKKCGDFAGFPSWVNGNIGGSNSQYREGDGIPYRLAITDLPAGTHTVKVEYDFSQGGIFALDRLTQFDLTQKSNPCGSTTLVTCSFANVVWGPAMPGEVASPSASQPALANSGNLFVPPALHLNDFPNGRLIAGWASTGQTLAFGAMDANVVQTGLASGNSQRHFSFEITVGSCPSGGCDVMIAWSGHVASEKDWGDNKGAGSISGSPFHMRVLDVDGSGGNQDRSVQLSAIITVGTVQIVKNTVGGNGLFGFTTDGTGNLPLNPQITTVAGTGSVTYTNVEQGIHTIDETSLPAGWSFTSLSCLSGGLPIGTVVGDQVSFDLIAGATVICTYTNTIQPASLTVIKHVVNDNGGIKTASDFTLSATCVVGSFAGAESPGTSFTGLNAGACTVSE
ncbi:MAG TPA: hypothetical protein VGR28_08510, partial [Candidatus Thermoplasmatota archaeon]|nr:hypothetical protein [Candidatus Thermoplasmatota archaeon]